ncbi:MAG: hypothetical protein ACLS69_01465 [Butyricicoccus sp.]
MSDKATNYQCPSCTGPLHYDGAAGRLQCDYCGSSFDPAEIEKLYAEKEQQAASQPETGSDTGEWQSSADEDWGTDADKMRVYSCPSCGAQLICEETTAATSCPYCGNPTVIPEQFSGILQPDYILPFKLSKEDAVSALKQHYKGKLLLPSCSAIITISRAGIYCRSRLTAKPRQRNCGNDARVPSRRHGNHRDQLLWCSARVRCRSAACRWMHRARCRMIIWIHQPFDYAGLKPFSTAYLPGFSRISSMFPSRRAQRGTNAVGSRCRMPAELRETAVVYLGHADRRGHSPESHRRALRAAAGLDAEYPLERQELHVCDERSDRTHGR